MAVFAICLAFAFLAEAEGNAFRGNLRAASMGSMSADKLRATVLEEVTSALGNGSRVTESRLKSIEDILRPTFAAMPKNEYGNLDDASARYVLHRLFVQRHAMYIKGLESGGQAFTTDTQMTEVLEDHIPAFVLSLFEERLKEKGLGLKDMAVLAATLEHLIHDEALARLEIVYQAHNRSKDERLGEFDIQELIDTYMTIFVMGKSNVTSTSVAAERSQIVSSYPGWHETRKFTQQVRSTVVASQATESEFVSDGLSFNAVTQIVEEVGERYGRWQDGECKDLKRLLVDSEHEGSGRVLIKDFYGSALSGNWQFSESVDYLKELGSLDDSDPSNPAVLIANYVNSPSNCLASSSIYSVCCINECEALMGNLEHKITVPEASPEQLAEIVSRMPSATVAAPRTLSTELQDRLREVAEFHGGKVPLHGRLFAQWLHHAYPRECPYPHTNGTVNPMKPSQWNAASGQTSTFTGAQMKQYLEKQISQEVKAPLMRRERWVTEEQLVAKHSTRVEGTRSWIRTVALLLAMGSAGMALLKASQESVTKGRQSILPTVHKHHSC
mmetsp:Transcript_55112/g.98353  ORF Transcript_55112/g.98353 Transcript_55112/m.98353 type:complete len:557 (-) Transcript_55112:31-1701(-)|eukprot:CAMPEP_0197658174 /NCGR_PEP_ID=MMETSP1338-20131121/45081_1 /TAXON_ID=43686 ORGANISM="Pelagodinium beii, Strain RCC1491" /NCGR_SAMPLE_ID=MMETSP1338 /ASSEMBLY_ACC=CAM_ASM_000754 /LENGTH=556 /DNA_ID=CAMNT_0043234715 /DNA_START=127 /DNA_END=1797 /DNA_ORIENTATION=+